MSKIDEYIEGLYEEINEKIQSTRNILQLAKSPEKMRILVQNESLMSALSRVLREDGRRSIELITNIVYIFFCFSNYSEFHNVITANKIGNICLGMTDQELKRYDIWAQDIKKIELLGRFFLIL
jgi:flagellin-specific chaperone FliS